MRSGVGPDSVNMGVMSQQGPEALVGQHLHDPGRKGFFQGRMAGVENRVIPQGGGADEQDPPDFLGIKGIQGQGRAPAHLAAEILAG